jgi:Ca2+-binding RTX toxin-like protein
MKQPGIIMPISYPPYYPDYTPRNVVGTDGPDNLRGALGNDTLQGGAGNDTMEGDMGDDTYIVRLSDAGQDTIGVNFSDTVVIEDNVKLSDLSLQYTRTGSSGGTLTIGLPATADHPALDNDLTILIGSSGYPASNVTIRTGSGETALIEDLLRTLSATQTGTDGNDNLVGFSGRDVMTAGNGNDTLSGGAGNDLLDGGAGNDQLWGDVGDDTLIGGDGDDVLSAGGGHDSLVGGAGIDTLYVGDINVAQQVWIDADSDDIVSLYGDLSRIEVGQLGEFGADTVALRMPNSAGSVLVVSHASQLRGLAIYNQDNALLSWSTVLARATGNSTSNLLVSQVPGGALLTGGSAAEELMGGMGVDTLRGGGGNDTLYGREGNDDLDGGTGNDSLNGGSGDDLLRASAGNDTLVGGRGNDVFDYSALTSANASGKQDVIVLEGNDTIQLGNIDLRAITISSYSSAEGRAKLVVPLAAAQGGGTVGLELRGLAASSSYPLLLNSRGEALTLGQLASGSGVTLLPGAARDGGDGNDLIFSGRNNQVLRGMGGNDTLWGGAQSRDTLLGGDGNDELHSSEYPSRLEGGAGNDTLYAKAGDQLIDGGAGADTLVITGSSYTGATQVVVDGQDRIVLKEMSKAQLQSTSTVYATPGESRLSMGNGLYMTYADAPHGLVFELADGTLNWGDAIDGIKVEGSDGDGADLLVGQGADDNLRGHAGDDTLLGGAGNDSLSDDQGNNMLDGGAGDDWLYVGSFNNAPDPGSKSVLYGGAGNDTLQGDTGDNVLSGGDGQDALYFDAGNDLMSGGDGADLFSFGRASLPGWLGTDTLVADASDTVMLWGDTALDLLRVSRDGQGVNIAYQSDMYGTVSTGILHLDDVSGLDGLRFSTATGATRTLADLLTSPTGPQPLNLTGTDGNDTLTGGAGNDTLNGLAGDDLLDGGAGADTFDVDLRDGGHDTVVADVLDTIQLADATDLSHVGGWYHNGQLDLRYDATTSIPSGGSGVTLASTDGLDALVLRNAAGQTIALSEVLKRSAQNLGGTESADTLTGIAGFDYVMAGGGDDSASGLGGDDTLVGQAGNDTLDGGEGNDRLDGGDGQDVLVGGLGNDTLTGGVDSDTLTGGAGADTYILGPGDGVDFIHADGQDTLQLGFVRSEMTVGRLGAFTPNAVRLDFAKPAVYQGFAGVVLDQADQLDGLTLKFSDGSTATWKEIMALATKPLDQSLTGTAGKDTLTGGGGNDTLMGLAGNDNLSGGAGNDSLNGGLGNDTLAGGTGNDTLFGDKGNDIYLFGRGDGFDTIIDKDSTWFNSDTLTVSGAKSSQLWFTRVGSSLDIAIIGTTDHVTVQDWFLSSANRLEKITAAGDNKTLTLSKLNNLISVMSSFTSSAMAGTDLPANTPAAITKLVASSWTNA